MFGKISQADKNVNTEGTGIGLFIAKNIVDSLNGKIQVQSEQGQYSRFNVTLPVENSLKTALETKKAKLNAAFCRVHPDLI